MKQRDPYTTIADIKSYAGRALALVRSHADQEILDDLHLPYTLERYMEIIGEAVNRLPDDFTLRYPEIPWRKIVGLRNILAHGYDIIDHALLIETARAHLPALHDTAQRMLEQLDSE